MEKKKTLYAAAFARRMSRTRSWFVDVSYLHADDLTEANFLYRAGNMQEILNYTSGKYPMRKVISIAPAVGHFVKDEKTAEMTAE